MIDLHSHILPGVDDGAHDLDEALTMAQMAVDTGTRVIAATPHRFWRGHDISADNIAWHVERLQGEMDRRGIPLRIVPGCEIPTWPDPLEKIDDGHLMRLGGPESTTVLIEPPFDRIPGNALRLLEALMEQGLTPVLAHPERNSEIQDDIGFLGACAQIGVVIQLTAGSLLGHFGREPRIAASAILQHTDWRIILASDCHWSHDRVPTALSPARDIAAEWLGDEAAANRMVEDLPAQLIGV